MRASPVLFLIAVLTASASAQRFSDGRPVDPKWFPLAVWLQSPHNAERYREIGVNLYVGLYDGPTKPQLEALAKAKMPVICQQNEAGLADKSDIIVGWMHGDEPDNAQARRRDGYEPPILPAKIVADYEANKRADKLRPVLLNLGQGAAWDGWYGRGERTNHPEDYAEYAKGGDIVSFDIYPVTHTHEDVKGKLEFVGRGVQRLRKWTKDHKPIWACIETGHVSNAKVRPTPEQVRTEVWMAIACGADGIIYFAHEFAPQFVEAGLLAHDDVRQAVAEINREVLACAEVLNSPQLPDAVTVTAKPDDAIAVRAHRLQGALHLFVASLHDAEVSFKMQVKGQQTGKVETVGEKQPQRLRGGSFRDVLPAYGVRHYRITR